MPKPHSPKVTIKLDLLRPQSNPEKIYAKFIKWLLSSGRFIFIFVEALVLIAFGARFKLDADLQSKKEAIDQQIPYLESLKPVELLVRQTQLKLSTIDSLYKNYANYPQILKKIADQTPAGVKIISLRMERGVSKVSINLSAQSQSNTDVGILLGGLKQDQFFSDINITSISLEKGLLSFSLSIQAKLASLEDKTL